MSEKGKKISSDGFQHFEKIFLFFWLCALGFIVLNKYQDTHNSSFDLMFYGVGLFMAAMVFQRIRHNNKRRAQAVYDCDDHLIVVKNNQKHKILFEDIMNVNFSESNNASEASLKLKHGINGETEIDFIPKYDSVLSLSGKTKSTVIDELIVKIHKIQESN